MTEPKEGLDASQVQSEGPRQGEGGASPDEAWLARWVAAMFTTTQCQNKVMGGRFAWPWDAHKTRLRRNQ